MMVAVERTVYGVLAEVYNLYSPPGSLYLSPSKS